MDLPFLPIALTTTGAAALINLWLQLRIIAIRVSHKIEVGDGGDDRMQRRMRAHLNFAETAPILLLLIALIEYSLGTSPWLWGAAITFLVARVLHPIGMDGFLPARQAGMGLTLLLTIALAGTAIAIPWLTPVKVTVTEVKG